MAQWKSKLSLGDEFTQYNEDKITITELGKVVADKIEKFRKRKPWLYHDPELRDIIFSFQHECESEDSFDDVMESLYDWGDDDHTCWIDTH